jgi:hypothetical protein
VGPFTTADYLTPRRLCVALAATAPAMGTPGCRFLPKIVRLASDPLSAPLFRDLVIALVDVPLVSHAGTPMTRDHFNNLIEYIFDDTDSVADYLVRTVGQVDSPEDLHALLDFIVPADESDGSILHGMYDCDGQIGCFLRKVSVMFSSISFEAFVDLYDRFRAYVARENNVDLDYDVTNTDVNHAHGNIRPVIRSIDDVDAVSAAFALSSGVPVVDSQEYLALRAQCRPRAGGTVVRPAADFAMHLEALRRRDYSGALGSLHRYYDLSLALISAQTGQSHAAPNGTAVHGESGDAAVPNQSGAVGGIDPSSIDARGHQYAALSLAALHFHMGHPDLASAALDDAVRAAQQCGDDACQARALRWIALTSSSPERRHQLLLHVHDRLALAREELQTVVTPFAKEANARLIVQPRSGDTFWRHEQRHHNALAGARMHRVLSRVGFDRADISVDSLLLSAAAWESHASLATALANSRIALSCAQRNNSRKSRTIVTSEEARALVAVALLEAKSGRAEVAISSLVETADSSDINRIKPDFAIDHSSSRPERELLQRAINWLRFERAIRRGELRIAGHFVESIAAFASRSSPDSDVIFGPDAALDAIEARCRWQLASQAYTEAAEIADRLSREAAVLTRPVRVVDGLRLKAEAHIQAGASSSALSSALSAVSLARGLGLEGAYVRSVLTLTDAMIRMNSERSPESATAARRTLDAVLPRALEGLGVEERGRARRLQAECILSNAGDVSERLDEVVASLEDGVSAYALADDRSGLRDCWYNLARVHDEVGNVPERNRAAKEFKRVVSELSHARTLFTS